MENGAAKIVSQQPPLGPLQTSQQWPITKQNSLPIITPTSNVISPVSTTESTPSYTLYGGQQIPRFSQDDETNSADPVDDSVTPYICNLTHDDGYMILCDKCSANSLNIKDFCQSEVPIGQTSSIQKQHQQSQPQAQEKTLTNSGSSSSSIQSFTAGTNDDLIGVEVRPVPVLSQDLRLQQLHNVLQDHTYANAVPTHLPSNMENGVAIIASQQPPLGPLQTSQQWPITNQNSLPIITPTSNVISLVSKTESTPFYIPYGGQQIPRLPQDDETNSAVSLGPPSVIGAELEIGTEAEVIRCICDMTHDDGDMILCDKCSVWQHVACMLKDVSNIPEDYFCELCQPRAVNKSRARSLQLKKQKESFVGANSGFVNRGEIVKNTKRKPNHYSPELRQSLCGIAKQYSLLQSILNSENKMLNDCINLEKRVTTVPYAGYKILVSSEDVEANCPLLELRGKYMLSTKFKKQNPSLNMNDKSAPKRFYRTSTKTHKIPGPFIFFYQLPGAEALMQTINSDGTYPPLPSQPVPPEICVDTSTYDSKAKFVRRSCRPNAEIQHIFENGTIHLFIVSITSIRTGIEITIKHEPHDLLALEKRNSLGTIIQPTSTTPCACGGYKSCPFGPDISQSHQQAESNSSSNTSAVNLSSANAGSKTTASPTEKTEKDLPKAMIKPNVLTHEIDGFIIQEASEPFPVNRQRYLDKDVNDEPLKKKAAFEEALNGNLSKTALPSHMVACEQCGKSKHKSKLKKKRFCSVTCTRQAKTSSNDSYPASGLSITNGTSSSMVKGSNKIESDGSNVATNNTGTEKMRVDSAGSASTQQTPSSNTNTQATANTSNTQSGLAAETPQMANWTVSDVCEFIKNIPGCSDYVESFEQQEIDGQALLLLKIDHLVNLMGVKFGPALKIVDKVEEVNQEITLQCNVQQAPTKTRGSTDTITQKQQSHQQSHQQQTQQQQVAISEICEQADSDTSKTSQSHQQAESNSSPNTSAVNLSSANAGSKTTASPTEKTEKDLPKAMIKPNVLTHEIDGFIIQEASEPFPFNRQRYLDKDVNDEPLKKKAALEEALNGNLSKTALPSHMVACEQCGKSKHKSKLKKKRFCSVTCTRQAKTSSNDSHPESGLSITNGTSSSMVEGSNKIESDGSNVATNNTGTEKMRVDSAGSASTQQTPSSNTNTPATANNSNTESGLAAETPQMANWTVSDVCEFIKNILGCSDYVESFEQQEIDGEALLLLKIDHLVNLMGVKFGPALKIVDKVESMKEINSLAV